MQPRLRGPERGRSVGARPFSPPLNRSPGDRHLPRTAWCGAAVPQPRTEATMATSQTAMLRLLLGGALAAVALLAPSAAQAADGVVASVDYPGVQHLHYRYGPIAITPGQNTIVYRPTTQKPRVDGYITRFHPDLEYTNGSKPRVDILHLHHGVWLMRRYPTFAAGEEKTITQFPKGFGYRYGTADEWILNYMLHNLITSTARVYLTWDVDFVPASTEAAASIKEVKPLWLDTGLGAYPVWDAKRGWGKAGRYTFPDDGRGAELNKTNIRASGRTLQQDITLVAAGGHVHPGGLWVDLKQTRGDQTREIFRSEAKYYEPAGAVSWDVSMTFTKPEWRVAVRKGDKLHISATYDTKDASWYEVMGIIDPLWYTTAPDAGGIDPFAQEVDWHGAVTHGHLRENDNHGGTGVAILPNAQKLLSGTRGRTLDIREFVYGQGDLSLAAAGAHSLPTVQQGRSLTFRNLDSPKGGSSNLAIYHTITGCRAPCSQATGIAYPVANGAAFDSGELGFGPRGQTAAAQRATWQTPKSLKAGTYTYFCRVHPFMRGAFRVVAR